MQLVIDLPPREEQIAFNRERWAEVLDDESLARFEGRVETDAFGNVVMMPPASGSHSYRTSRIMFLLHEKLGGFPLPEAPISTMDGVRAADIAWYSNERFPEVKGQIAFEKAPEICVEVISPRNTKAELVKKKRLYFDAGSKEVWFCELDGTTRFFLAVTPDEEAARSAICPEFPAKAD